MSGYTSHDKERIASIATQLLAGKVKAGTVDRDDDAAMDKEMRRCVQDAVTIYNAALEYVAG
jgi:hypothetical protein